MSEITTLTSIPVNSAEINPNKWADGRFKNGHNLGKGNAFANRLHAYKRAFFRAVTPQDIADIAVAMIGKAKAGDVAAASQIMDRSMGKPIQETRTETGVTININVSALDRPPGAENVIDIKAKSPA